MKKLLLVIGVIAFGFAGYSQDYTFRYDMQEMEEVVNTQEIKPHFLGNEIATRLQLLKESYTYKEPNEISGTENAVIEKPSIYNAVRKVNRYLKKAVKKGDISHI